MSHAESDMPSDAAPDTPQGVGARLLRKEDLDASSASIIVSNDEDLLQLEKPFGIEILKPAAFVARFK